MTTPLRNKYYEMYWISVQWIVYEKELEYTKGVIKISISKDWQHNGQKNKDKQRFTKHYTEN